jgi:steroid 5-alpha reductase family enzyme
MPLDVIAIIVILLYFFGFFVVGTRISNNSIVDMGWGAGFVVSSGTLYFLGAQNDAQFIALLMVAFWGIRLSYSLVKRNLRKPEDFRYAQMRKQFGDQVVIRSFVQIYLLQALFMIVVSLPLIRFFASSNAVTWSWWAVPGVIVYLIGLYYEAIGDVQLRRHQASKSGTLLTTGLWATTRHPNYFGDSAVWWGLYLYVVALVPALWWTIVSPIIMTWLLRYVSGVPLLEQRMANKQGWEAYAKRTNIFFPWFPRRTS